MQTLLHLLCFQRYQSEQQVNVTFQRVGGCYKPIYAALWDKTLLMAIICDVTVAPEMVIDELSKKKRRLNFIFVTVLADIL